LGSFEATAHRFGMTPIAAPVRSAAEINGVLSALAREADAGFVVVPDQFLALQRSLLVKLAAQYCLPAVYPFRYFVIEGGLMSYGVFPADLYRRSAAYVDRILRGAKPSELPVQGPTRFELIINRKTVNALGLDVPRTLLAHVDEVIE
jgi:putative tryptophan/tyrosine transport system substrate-binding protein